MIHGLPGVQSVSGDEIRDYLRNNAESNNINEEVDNSSPVPPPAPTAPQAAQNVGHCAPPEKVNNISEAGLRFIISHEGFSATVYLDQGGKPTIGYGHLITNKEQYGEISKIKAQALLSRDVRKTVDLINKYVSTPLNQHQFDAVVSYVFNTGSLRNTKLVTYLNAGNFQKAASEMDIITAGGIISKGLINRRQDEQTLFLYGKY
jgi:lysozyme